MKRERKPKRNRKKNKRAQHTNLTRKHNALPLLPHSPTINTAQKITLSAPLPHQKTTKQTNSHHGTSSPTSPSTLSQFLSNSPVSAKQHDEREVHLCGHCTSPSFFNYFPTLSEMHDTYALFLISNSYIYTTS
jgi:hypothetical protein